MLLLTPRKITAVIVLSFSLLFSIKTVSYSLQRFGHFVDSGESELDVAKLGKFFSQKIDALFPLLPWIERNDYDLHLFFRKELKPHRDIAIVEINEPSIRRFGQFPFPRRVYAALLEKLSQAGVRSVAFDIAFPERERNEALTELGRVKELLIGSGQGQAGAAVDQYMRTLNNDDVLVAAISRAEIPVVTAFTFATDQQGMAQPNERAAAALRRFSLYTSQVNIKGFTYDFSTRMPVLPFAELLEGIRAPSSVGHFTADADGDSVIRRTPLILAFDDGVYGSLGLISAAQYLGIPLKVNDEIHEDRGKALRVVYDNGNWARHAGTGLDIPVGPDGTMLVNYYGKERTFRYYELVDVLDGKHARDLAGKIVFVGVTAVGLKDIRATPFSSDYPGVEVHATIASNILNRDFMVSDFRYHFFGFVALILGGLLLSVIAFRYHPSQSFVLTAAAIALLQYVAQSFFFDEGVSVPTLLPSSEFLVILFAGVLHRYFTQEKEKKYVRDALSRYVSGPVVEEILKDQTKLRLGGQKKRMTVMFCDMVGFTKMSEHMDAAKLTQLLNQFFTRMTHVILRNQGTLDKYMGDAIMCFWGAPLDLPNHAELACKTALEMMRELAALNEEWKEKHGFTIGLRIGINTGEMSVGNMGSDQVFSYTVLGDNVNLGSRLEGVNNVYGTRVLVSGATEAEAGAAFTFRRIDRVQVKGKEDAVEVFELVGEAGEKGAEWIRLFELGLEHYRHAKWAEAEAAFKACLAQRENDAPAKIFLQRIEELKAWPPDAWDGVWRLASK